MEPDALAHIQGLGDLGLAAVLCLTAEQHGIILAHADELDNVAEEIAAICAKDLSLSTAMLDCRPNATDLEHFRESILVESHYNDDDTPAASQYGEHHLTSADMALDERRVADVVLAKHLDRARPEVQIQALELMDSRRIYTRAAMHRTGRKFLLLAVNEASEHQGMNPHLNDRFAMAHYPGGGEGSDVASLRSVSSASMRSVVRSRGSLLKHEVLQSLDPGVLKDLRMIMAKVTMTAEVSAYLQNVVVAMRLHRYVAGGITAQATRDLRAMAKAMTVLHGLDYVTPAIVALATRKVYLHRLILADEYTERSLRWGGDPLAVRQQMEDIDVETAIDAAIASVPEPL